MIIISRGGNCKTSEFRLASTWRARETTKRLFSIPSWSKPCWWRSVLLDVVTCLLRSFFFGDQFLGNIMLCKCMPSISQKTNAKFSWEYRACFFIGKTKRTSYKGFFFHGGNSLAFSCEMHRYFYFNPFFCEIHKTAIVKHELECYYKFLVLAHRPNVLSGLRQATPSRSSELALTLTALVLGLACQGSSNENQASSSRDDESKPRWALRSVIKF